MQHLIRLINDQDAGIADIADSPFVANSLRAIV